MMIKNIGRFRVCVDMPPQFNITLEVDQENFRPIMMREEDARDLKYAMESALREIEEGKK